MDKKEADSIKWSQYQLMTPDLPEELMAEMVEIVENLDSRKVDKVNWEERRQMDEATKRSGHLIHSGEEMTDEEVESVQQLDETAGATSEKEKDFMSGMSDILKELEQLNDGQR